ncbi:hypothetical protein RRG08_058875 [Elysia crispata]|uniref:Ig-like domain-containing protein n=1 Tax=Elysia crispata TaxID=231223 RepID=A0AAE1CQ72_9GAST|nr:hypothetical protein RRG08_058875 [Elysia crispata]
MYVRHQISDRIRSNHTANNFRNFIKFNIIIAVLYINSGARQMMKMISQALLCVFITALMVVGQTRSELTVRIEPSARKLLVPEGSMQTFICIVEHHPKNSDVIKWVRPYNINSVEDKLSNPSIKLNSDATYTTTVELTVDKFTKSHQGTFGCDIASDERRERAAIEVSTITETKPEAVYYFGNDTVKLYCKASLGKEAVFQHWLKNNKNLEEGEKYKMHANGSLSILKLDRDDAGDYMARYNLTDQENKTYDCVVSYKAGPLVLDMAKSINKDEGESVDIKCEVKGWPHPKVTWLKNDKVLRQQKDKITFSSHNEVTDAKLTISNLKYEDEGMYTCNAYSVEFNETNEKSIKLRVKDKLAWLWPFLGIIAQIIVLVLLIVAFEKFKKKDDSHPHEQ